MFDLHLRIAPLRNGRLHVHIPHQFRWFFGTLAVLTAWVAFYTGIWSPVAIGVLCLAVLALLYDERWVFDREASEVHYRMGFLFVGRHLGISMREIERFECSTVNQKGRDLCQLLLWTIGQEPFLIDSRPAEYGKLLLEEAEIIAEYCGRPLDRT
ncbi:hypothetical protein [Spirochaeta dissipatitropha]